MNGTQLVGQVACCEMGEGGVRCWLVPNKAPKPPLSSQDAVVTGEPHSVAGV